MLLLSTPLGFAQMFDVFSNLLISAKPKTSILDSSLEEHADRLQALSCSRRNYVLGITSNGGSYPNGSTQILNGSTPRRSLFRSYITILDALKYPVIMLLLLVLTVSFWACFFIQVHLGIFRGYGFDQHIGTIFWLSCFTRICQIY